MPKGRRKPKIGLDDETRSFLQVLAGFALMRGDIEKLLEINHDIGELDRIGLKYEVPVCSYPNCRVYR